MLEVFLSFEGTYIKLYFVEGWNVNNLFFANTVFYIRELNFLNLLKILIDGWSIYFKITRFAAVQLSLHFYVDVCTRCTMSSCHIHMTRGKNDNVIGLHQEHIR